MSVECTQKWLENISIFPGGYEMSKKCFQNVQTMNITQMFQQWLENDIILFQNGQQMSVGYLQNCFKKLVLDISKMVRK